MEFCVKCQTVYIIITDLEKARTQYGSGNIIRHALKNDNFSLRDIDFGKMSKSEEYLALSEGEKVKLERRNQDGGMVKLESVYYFCLNCHYYEEMKPTTKIYSKSHRGIQKINDNMERMINNPVLPRTRKYKCINAKCESNKKEEGEIVIIPDRSNMKMTYICSVCKAQWH
jgi:hypothetical protein